MKIKTDCRSVECFCCAVVSKQTHGTVDDLESLRHRITQLQAETSDGLKKNVYKHYHQFIETAKEISSTLIPLSYLTLPYPSVVLV